jgi:hypothetical protein
LAEIAREIMPVVAVLSLASGLAVPARAQLPTEEERLKIFTTPEDVKKKLEKDKSRPPIEMFRSQVAPFDILPYMKAHHWSTISLEVRANYDDYSGMLQTAPITLLGLDQRSPLPQEIVFRRDARLPKTQRMRVGFQVMLPQIPKPPRQELGLELIRPDAIRPDEVWPASLRTLEAHQMLILILTKETSDAYAFWNRFQALYPRTADRGDALGLEKKRYYRLVLPLDPGKPPLSSHPLAWTTISHVIWDGMAPDTLNPTQQQAMLDWLHWGGQLTLVGGAGTTFSVLKDSFLSPYIPAEVTGENALLSRADLTPLSIAYQPLNVRISNDSDDPNDVTSFDESIRYRGPSAINPPPSRPVFLTGLRPNPGAVGIALGDSGDRLVGVERRVGRGRILMLALNPTDPALAAWLGLDTFVRRVVLRRPEDPIRGPVVRIGRQLGPEPEVSLPGPDLSWVRYLSRDMKAPRSEELRPKRATASEDPFDAVEMRPIPARSAPSGGGDDDPTDDNLPKEPVAAWLDSAALPVLCRDTLEEASGIKIPSSLFVLKVVLAYLLALVPLNWLLCRYVIGRRELAWVVAPLLALGFAVGVERAAAYDMGYNSACDEVDVIEAHGDYPRAHVSRFGSLYTTGRTRYTISYPNDPTALALPLDNGRTLRGEDVTTSAFQSFPVPALEGYLIQPRSLGMFRAEEMVSLDGAVSLVSEGPARQVVNGSGLELRDAVVVDVSGPSAADRREVHLGTIAPGATVEVKEQPRDNAGPSGADALRPQRFLRVFREAYEDRPENRGEIRLVAWVAGPRPGQKIEPPVDRHRGFTAVVVHLRSGPPPSPDGPVYNKATGAPGAPATYEVVPGPPPGIGQPRARPQVTRRPRPALKQAAPAQPVPDGR